MRELAVQFTHPLALLLWGAAALAWVGGIPALAVAIVAVIVLNAVFAFAQEIQAERATEALRDYLPLRTRVRRGSEVLEIDAIEVVPGDVLLVEEGDRLCADARVISGSVEIDAAPLTGESQPVSRSSRQPEGVEPLLEAEDLVFSGTLCTGGDAVAVVFATGMGTELGRIASLSERVRAEVSPLQVQINDVAKLIALIAVGAGVVFFAVGTLFAGLSLGKSIVFAIGLLVANVPEGLLPTITLALAVGVRRMARRRALVKRLAAVETLGSTDVICTDKTGTLTTGTMVVRRFWGDGREISPRPDMAEAAGAEPFSGLLRTAVRCNNASVRKVGEEWERSGDPGESALLVAAQDLGAAVPDDDGEGARRTLYRFDARLKRMTTFDQEPDGSLWMHSKGAPLELLERCSSIRTADGDRPLDDADRRAVATAFEDYARDGLRVLAFAERQVVGEEPGEDRLAAESGLTFLGLVALEDPPRPEVRAAVLRCRQAGISVMVVSGDHGLTTAAIARNVGIVTGEPRIVSGSEVEAMAGSDLARLLESGEELIVARSNPETKLHLVDALRRLGHTVAMTGDGVNDAPALRRADIGVAMGASGTEVAREAATMVLTDDNFASITAAIEEGRVVYENIKKFITYIFAHATPEVVPFLIFALSGGAVPLPLTALQILAIDLGTETLPALALGREPAEPGILDRPPRKRTDRVVDRPMLVRAWGYLGLLEAALVTGGFFFVLLQAGWSWGDAVGPSSPLHDEYLQATAMTFAGITACQVGTAFAARTTRSSLWQIGVFSNKLLLAGIAFELAFAAAVVYWEPLQRIFETRGLGVAELALLATFPVLVWGSDELRRWFVRRRDARAAVG